MPSAREVALSAATLPRTIRRGAVVWALSSATTPEGWEPKPIGRVVRVERDNVVVSTVRGDRSVSFTECPLFTDRETAASWARENPMKVPTVSGLVSR